jgi:ADP-ribosyl-[dinitrogen reductase] hydrolase
VESPRRQAYRQAVIDTINLGGDADTTGAMVGAITGALYGKVAIPAEWYEKLHARECFEDRVDAIVDRRSNWSPMTPLVVLETGWAALNWPV